MGNFLKCSCFDAFMSPLPGRAIARKRGEVQHQCIGVPAGRKIHAVKFLYRNSQKNGFTQDQHHPGLDIY